MLLTGPFAMLSMPSFDFHLPPCTEGFLIHLSPLWQLPLLPLFPSVAQFPCVGLIILCQPLLIYGANHPTINILLCAVLLSRKSAQGIFEDFYNFAQL